MKQKKRSADDLRYEISSVIDSAAYGGLDIPPATEDIIQLLKQAVMKALPKKLDVLEFEEDEEQNIILLKGHNLAIDKAIASIEKLFD